MNQQHIHCLVDTCHYYAQGNKCVANEIMVTNDEFGSQQPDRIDAAMAKQLSPTPADTCMATCCKTFVPKNSNKINADSVQKMS
ncbi:MAG TPA: DUF1540 domain-containing protein [Desulfotomaculum sp.]|nr:MAG: hypothetical protein VR67_14330 [Peptococcaceae bacterium BRH_c8a]KJS74117.1 MAG: hypothetical protein JL56_09925 [Desulfotomaculum sp. BICA1-6]HBX22843.1 DUF1540 domain-containing protein [Desulfotomaculum sp.]